MAEIPATESEAQPALASPLSVVMRREPVSCAPDASIRTALEIMRSRAIGSMIVTAADGTPLGIFTLRDVLDRVTLAGYGLDRPISGVMNRDVFTMPPQASAYEAALAMVRRGIRHILVVDRGRLIGLITEKDLFSLQRINIRQLAGAIREADSVESMVQFSADIRQLAHNMLVQGVAAEPLTQFITSLNDLLTERIIELEFCNLDLGDIRYCWIALGSEGRYEQTLYTDQDNGIIFATNGSIEAARSVLLPPAQRVNQALDRCGFPLCKGNIMAANAHWCLNLEEWEHRFANWIDSGDPEALLHGAIFFDFRPLHGDATLTQALRQWLLGHVQRTPRFLHQMAANALRNRPPLGVFRDFATSGSAPYPHTIDLKLNGAMLFADAARIYSLAAGIAHTNTCQRLRQFGALRNLPRLEVQAWIDAFLLIQILRLRQQHANSLAGLPLDNRLNPDHLNELERRTLKEALRLARRLQSRLALDYQL